MLINRQIYLHHIRNPRLLTCYMYIYLQFAGYHPAAQPLCAELSFLNARFSLILANALFFATGRRIVK
jgi:uncharacterized membrane protein YbhN (UPF0104 family)